MLHNLPLLLLVLSWLASPTAPAPANDVDCLRDLREASKLIDERWSFKLFKPGAIDIGETRTALELEARNADSAEACTDLLSRFMSHLNDGHSRLLYYPGLRYTTPAMAVRSQRERLTRVPGQRPPVHAYIIARDTIDETARTIPIGSEILSVDGVSVDSLYRSLERRVSGSTPQWRDYMCDRQLLRGPEASDVELTLREPDGSLRRVSVTRRSVRRQLIQEAGALSDTVRIASWKRLDGDWGYLKYTSFGFGTLENTIAAFDEALDSLMDSRGLILDLRGNVGGYVAAITEIAGRFVRERTTVGFYQTREPRQDVIAEIFDSTTMSLTTRPRLLAKPRGPIYDGPLVILIDRRCFSACESFAGGLQSIRRALVIGREASGGGSGFVRGMRLPSGATISFSTSVAWLPDGGQIEGNGVAPDIRVSESAADWAAGRDPTLQRAMRALQMGEGHSPPR